MASDSRPDDGQVNDDTDLPPGGDGATGPTPFKEEIAALLDDGQTYAKAEIAFQKTRLSFAADRGKSVIICAILALGFLHLTLIALVVGAVIALAPVVGGWAATGIVVAALVLGMVVLGWIIRSKVKEVSDAFAKSDKGGDA